jgi:membrane protein YqaA with SNARE-associated domain
MLSYCYDKALSWSKHSHAKYYLAFMSFIESSIFPVPPDIMLITMGLAKPKSSLYNAIIATVFSVLGGILGYYIGYYAIDIILPIIEKYGYTRYYIDVKYLFAAHGIWIVILAGFTPMPYKIFTIAAGALHMNLWPFILASILGRGARFFLVSGILFFAGSNIERYLRRFINIIGWAVLISVLVIVVVWHYL